MKTSEIPISIVSPLIEYNTTLIIEEVNEYYLNYDVFVLSILFIIRMNVKSS